MCEVKCGAAALDVADRQNVHSMTLAARAVVELFRLVRRERESLTVRSLPFWISYDHESVRIYGHYPIIEAAKTTFYRYLIHNLASRARRQGQVHSVQIHEKHLSDVDADSLHEALLRR
ncbi:uncharacterized protein A1O5_06329 [Cladophialophora psammophila CBS 110553]|uniref:DUF7924 domain-containing protein n=1 Tax=Cladophialophora psammophila CBS 110553 TaxID=1182543 RepID=W9X012_9EURO|nr:uncharacterized protein A1O5_06329 [Cladophialophora psammophila CBS 110553]EXJ70261.1 hypothetical protein A1O5_06329 [Cladophialophora psammophila CBS 110553]